MADHRRVVRLREHSLCGGFYGRKNVRKGFAARGRLVSATAMVALALPGAASAASLGTDDPAYCDPDVGQDFARWADPAYYRLSPGGTFEAGTPSWGLSGGAKAVAGNEPFKLRSGSRSLYLPKGAVATSPRTCFSFGDWHARFVVRNTGSSSAQLEVDILVYDALGILSVLDGGTIRAGSAWAPSPRISALISNVGALAGTEAISVRLKAHGTRAAFYVDDLFVDPLKKS
jgi:hypothetical protein